LVCAALAYFLSPEVEGRLCPRASSGSMVKVSRSKVAVSFHTHETPHQRICSKFELKEHHASSCVGYCRSRIAMPLRRQQGQISEFKAKDLAFIINAKAKDMSFMFKAKAKDTVCSRTFQGLMPTVSLFVTLVYIHLKYISSPSPYYDVRKPI